MSQSLTALYLQNPELANALRRRQEGAALYQAGSDASPVLHPLQGLSRLAQALVGGYEQGQADKEIKGAQDRRQALMAQLAGPMGGMTPPPAQADAPPMTAPQQPVGQQALAPAEYEPIIRQASSDTGIPANILTGLFAQESGFRPDARNPRSSATGIGQVLDTTASNPGYGLPPLSPEARLDPAQAIPWSARYLAARAQGLGVTDWQNPQQVERALRAYGENTPEYAQAVMRRAGMGGETIPAQMPGQGGAPGAPPVPRTPDAGQYYMAQAGDYERRAMLAQQMGEHGMATLFMQMATGARQMAAARVPQPTEVERLAEAAGLRPGTPEYQAMVRRVLEKKGDPQTVVNTGERYAEKKAIDDWGTAKTAASATARRATLFDTALNVLDNEAFSPGATAEMRLKIAQLGSALGLETNAPAGEVLKAVQRQLEIANTPQGQGQITENERVLIREMLPILGSTPEGMRMLIEATKLLDERDKQVFRIYNDSARKNGGVPSLVDVNEQIADLPPALPPAMVARLNKWKDTGTQGGGETTPTAGPGGAAQGGGWSIRPKQ